MKTTVTPIEIIFADDQEVLRKGFRALLQDEGNIQIVAEASNGNDLLKLVAQHNPDVVLTDIKMPGMNGIEATLKIMQQYPGTAVVAFTMFSEDYLLMDMLEAGALGYVLKDARPSEIIDAIQAAYRNRPYYCPDTKKKLNRLIDANIYDPLHKLRRPLLSNREKQVLILICRECSNQEIASELDISIKTVEIFRKKLYIKTNCRNIAGLVKYAIRLGLFNPLDN